MHALAHTQKSFFSQTSVSKICNLINDKLGMYNICYTTNCNTYKEISKP